MSHSPTSSSSVPSLFNPISKYSEKTEIEGSTLFELHGLLPRTIPNSPTYTTNLPLKSLTDEMKCPVCLMYMKKTLMVMECYHRFCTECIEKCLRMNNKECPSCRIKIPSKRSCRPDVNFDKLIEAVYGDVEKLEKQELEEITSDNMVKSKMYSESARLGLEQQMEKRRAKKSYNSSSSSSSSSGGPSDNDSSSSSGNKRRNTSPQPQHRPVPHPPSQNTSDRASFILRPHPLSTSLPQLEKEHIQSANTINIHHLKQFVQKKLGIGKDDLGAGNELPLDLFTAGSGPEGEELDDEFTLADVKRQFDEGRRGGEDHGEREFIILYKLSDG